jgi:hypothetical protein
VVYHKKDIGKGATEVGSIYIVTLLFWHVHFLTTRTVYLDPRGPNFLAHADGQGGLPVAEHSRTDSEGRFSVFFFHYCEALGRDYVSCVYESVDICCLLIDGEVS